MTERDDIENLFSSTFEGAEMLPPPAVKDAIDGALFSAAPVGRKKAWMWWSLLLLVLIGGGGAWMLVTNSPQTNQAAATGAHQHDSINSSEYEANALPNQEAGRNFSSASNSEIAVHNDGASTIEREKTASERSAYATNVSGSGASKTRFDEDNFQNPLASLEDSDQDLNGPDGSRFPDEVESGLNDGEAIHGVYAASESSIHPSGNGFSETKIGVDALATVPSTHLPNAVGVWIPGAPSVVNPAMKSNPWSLAAYTGTSFGFNTLRGNPDMKIEEQAGLYASLEALYPLSRRISISGGFDFAQRNDRLVMNSTINDSIFTGNDVVYVYDSMQVVIDSLYFPNYEMTSSVQENVGYVRYYSIGIPLYVHYTVNLTTNFSFNAAIGARFSYQKYRNEEIAPNILYPDTYKQFGVNVSFRPEFIYHVNRMGVGIYGRFEYDILNGMQWNALTRTRWSAGLGLSVRYKL
ncbi:MAG: hypothetical protein A3D92_07525 [Bacteroidetes bacterium RIFCSPHIGHO2_02_FULL_44_7]|nr:MAG: hypothetical protein A3D92_07525 [Bacteroidetes bacterium RIFCSPHIGHO2_02_FULL_44_7]